MQREVIRQNTANGLLALGAEGSPLHVRSL